MTPFIGVRISWLIVARNADLAAFGVLGGTPASISWASWRSVSSRAATSAPAISSSPSPMALSSCARHDLVAGGEVAPAEGVDLGEQLVHGRDDRPDEAPSLRAHQQHAADEQQHLRDQGDLDDALAVPVEAGAAGVGRVLDLLVGVAVVVEQRLAVAHELATLGVHGAAAEGLAPGHGRLGPLRGPALDPPLLLVEQRGELGLVVEGVPGVRQATGELLAGQEVDVEHRAVPGDQVGAQPGLLVDHGHVLGALGPCAGGDLGDRGVHHGGEVAEQGEVDQCDAGDRQEAGEGGAAYLTGETHRAIVPDPRPVPRPDGAQGLRGMGLPVG